MAVQLSQAYYAWEQRTLERGKLEGEQIAEQRGKLEGEQRGKLEVVPALMQRGFSAQEVAQILGLTVEQVQSCT